MKLFGAFKLFQNSDSPKLRPKKDYKIGHWWSFPLNRSLVIITQGLRKRNKNLPGFVESREHVSLNDLVADVAEVAEELVVVSLAVGQTLALVVSIA